MYSNEGPRGKEVRASSISIQLIGSLAATSGALWINIAFAKSLGSEGLGVLSIAIAIIAVTSPIGAFGMKKAVLRMLSNELAHSRREIASSAFTIEIVAALCQILLATSIAYLFYSEVPIGTILILGASAFFGTANISEAIALSSSQGKLIGQADLLKGLIGITLTLVVASHLDSLFVCAAIVSAQALARFAYLTTRFNKYFGANFKIDVACSLARVGIPALAGELLAILILNYGELYLGKVLGPESVAQYAIANKLVTSTYFIPITILWNYYPSLTRSKGKDLSQSKKLISQAMVVGLCIALLDFFVAPLLIHLFYGSEFSEAKTICRILSISAFFMALKIRYNLLLLSAGREKVSFLLQCLIVTLIIITSFLIVPSLGAPGMALSISLSNAVAVAFCLAIESKQLSRSTSTQ